jgi:nucleotide-binding universal stress UspA family protein
MEDYDPAKLSAHHVLAGLFVNCVREESVHGMQVACESAFLIRYPAERIGELDRDVGADLIVTASHHPKFLARLFNLGKAPRIMHRARCPVLVSHEKTCNDSCQWRSLGATGGLSPPPCA